MYIDVYIYSFMYIYIYVCVYVYMYIYIYVCVIVYYIYILNRFEISLCKKQLSLLCASIIFRITCSVNQDRPGSRSINQFVCFILLSDLKGLEDWAMES